MAGAFRSSAQHAGQQFLGLIDEALTEALSRDAVIKVLGNKLSGKLAEMHSDLEVIGRLTASGSQDGEEVQGGKASYILPAIIWFVLAYDSFQEAALANALLGGETCVRALFIGLLVASRDGPDSFKKMWTHLDVSAVSNMMRLHSLPISRYPLFGRAPFKLCMVPGSCQSSDAEVVHRHMHNVTTAAIVVPLSGGSSREHRYRIFSRLNATKLLEAGGADAENVAQPLDWIEEEDGPWEPPQIAHRVGCVARYFQFTTRSGRHAPLSTWPAKAMCEFSLLNSVAYDSFDLVLPEPLAYIIGGAVLVAGRHKVDVKLPSLAFDVSSAAPKWSALCSHVGLVKLPEEKWQLD